MEPGRPKYEWGMRVLAAIDLVNDGTFPDRPDNDLLVAAGSEGEIVQVGLYTEANVPVYLVEFGEGLVVGCLEEEITT